MIDLHSHILPGLDDGAANLDESIAMAKIAVDCGIRGMAVTPHCIDDRRVDLRTAMLLLRDALAEENIPLILYPGMEILGTEDTAQMLLEGRLLTLNGSRYPLIEFAFNGTGEEETRVLESVIDAGYRPIIAHPERYAYVHQDPTLLNVWRNMGCLFQVNRGSFLGHFGERSRHFAYEMTARRFTTVVATDAHSVQRRIPWMRDIRDILNSDISSLAAQVLLCQNPLKILRNEVIEDKPSDLF